MPLVCLEPRISKGEEMNAFVSPIPIAASAAADEVDGTTATGNELPATPPILKSVPDVVLLAAPLALLPRTGMTAWPVPSACATALLAMTLVWDID